LAIEAVWKFALEQPGRCSLRNGFSYLKGYKGAKRGNPEEKGALFVKALGRVSLGKWVSGITTLSNSGASH
jgi:hypothetical protein